MTTASQARAVVRSRIEGGNIVDSAGAAVPLRWQNESVDSLGNVSLPDVPSPFIYVEFLTERSGVIERGGPSRSRHRNPARIDAYVFVPKGKGLGEAESIAEQIAALFRSYNDNGIFVETATVHPGGDGADLKPPGLTSEVGNYFWAACEVELRFDLIG